MNPVENATSRHEPCHICSACGVDEAARDYMQRPPLPRELWHDHDPYAAAFLQFDKQHLMSRSEVLEFLKVNGEHEPAITMISDRYEDEFGIDPVWHYHLSDGWHTGAYIIPIQEGYMMIPYDEVDSEYYEILLPEAATLLDVECCEHFKKELQTYADEMCKIFRLITSIINDGRSETACP